MEHGLTHESLLRHEAFVLRLARTLVRGEADAEEVAQRTLASAVEHPPKHAGVRAWLAHVTRNHAHELHRSARRRTAREVAAARPEAVPAAESAMERLEMEHGVVRAVLSLDDPYRSVVVATYYEGLTPAEIAERRGVPAGTVRSQLSRAHELLRTKLDREHGERASWMRGLTGLLTLHDAPVASAGPAALGSSLAIGAGVAACIAAVFVVRAAFAPPGAVELAAVEPLVAPVGTLTPPALHPTSPDSARVAAAASPDAQSAEVSWFTPADEPAQLLQQSRQIKQLILDRRLAVTPDERARAGIREDSSTSGVVRLLDRNAFGLAYSLPWMREGGAYYSFTERAHDFNRRPQVSLEGGNLGVGPQGLLVDLGERSLADISAARGAPADLTPVQRLLWEVASADVDPGAAGLHALRESRVQEAEGTGMLKPDEARAARSTDPRARAGHAYLLRSISREDHDVLVAVKVLEVAEDQCTIAYRILESRPVANQRGVHVPDDYRVVLPPAPAELARRSEPELRAALDVVRRRAEEVLFDRIPPEVEARFGALRDQPDAGLARLVPYFSVWAELTTSRTGRADVAFLTRQQDASGDVLFQGVGDQASLSAAPHGGSAGAFVDLGTTPLDSVTLDLVAAQGELGAYVSGYEFPRATELPAVQPARDQAISAARNRESAAAKAFRSRVGELGSSARASAIVGRTFALRSVHFGERDLLAALHVASRDEHGAVIAWRILKTWPVTARD
ncbi:MAG: sigma-70 family RNA polymerase sigma factor [Planctomycetes bacterium]|nr:sigma-70 family RNA polymerase sigma factor [Planctomycetota bacterium]